MAHDEWQALSPGSKRRYDPEVGIKKHNERIHRESKIADSKNLPFTFSKPLKSPGKKFSIECACGNVLNINTNTVAIICSRCNKLLKIGDGV